MSELDIIREVIAYLKFWQGIMVVTDISIIGWLITSAGSASAGTVVLAIIGAGAITLGVFLLHRRIGEAIKSLRDL
ncbi:MAG: hypothetical protein ACREVE_16205 [Gammaproteobacteria bacterium]